MKQLEYLRELDLTNYSAAVRLLIDQAIENRSDTAWEEAQKVKEEFKQYGRILHSAYEYKQKQNMDID